MSARAKEEVLADIEHWKEKLWTADDQKWRAEKKLVELEEELEVVKLSEEHE